jgi:hypothetical protein
VTTGVNLNSLADQQIKDDKQSAEEERETTQDKEGPARTTPISQTYSDKKRGDSEEDQRAEQWKIRREWLTIIGLFLAASAAFYQGYVLSKQAGTLNRQLLEMKSAEVQTDKLIQSNADLAAAAKAQAIAEQQTAATAHDTLVADLRARIAAGNVSLNPIQSGQAVIAAVTYSNVGKEFAPIDPIFRLKRWSKADWQNGNATRDAALFETSCLAIGQVRGANVAYPSNGFGSGYRNQVQSDDAALADRFVADDDLLKGDAVVGVYSCFPYRTLSEIHHTAACSFYMANKTPSVGSLNICDFGNAAD